jgi:hypothetical protein
MTIQSCFQKVIFQNLRHGDICNPSYLGGWSRRIAWTQEFEASLGNTARPHVKKKKSHSLHSSLQMQAFTATHHHLSCRWSCILFDTCALALSGSTHSKGDCCSGNPLPHCCCVPHADEAGLELGWAFLSWIPSFMQLNSWLPFDLNSSCFFFL